MEAISEWAGFIGAWLLLAGPVYQAALELQDEEIANDQMHDLRDRVTPKRLSLWWLLLPPVYLYLQQRQQRDHRREFLKAISPEEFDLLQSYLNKARGWMFVAGGAFFIAVKETYSLIHYLEFTEWLVFVIAVVLAIACIANTAFMISKTRKMNARYGTGVAIDLNVEH